MPENIKIRSEQEQIKQTKKTYCFLSPCSITKIFWAPIAKIRLNPVKKPKTIKFIFNKCYLLTYSIYISCIIFKNNINIFYDWNFRRNGNSSRS